MAILISTICRNNGRNRPSQQPRFPIFTYYSPNAWTSYSYRIDWNYKKGTKPEDKPFIDFPTYSDLGREHLIGTEPLQN